MGSNDAPSVNARSKRSRERPIGILSVTVTPAEGMIPYGGTPPLTKMLAVKAPLAVPEMPTDGDGETARGFVAFGKSVAQLRSAISRLIPEDAIRLARSALAITTLSISLFIVSCSTRSSATAPRTVGSSSGICTI